MQLDGSCCGLRWRSFHRALFVKTETRKLALSRAQRKCVTVLSICWVSSSQIEKDTLVLAAILSVPVS